MTVVFFIHGTVVAITDSWVFFYSFSGGMMMQEENFQKTANRVSVVTMAGNLLLSVFKLLAGMFAHSGAMISDAE